MKKTIYVTYYPGTQKVRCLGIFKGAHEFKGGLFKSDCSPVREYERGGFLTTEGDYWGSHGKDYWLLEYMFTKKRVRGMRDLPKYIQDAIKGTWLEKHLNWGIPNVNHLFAEEPLDKREEML